MRGIVLSLALAASHAAVAQSLAARLARADGRVQVVFPSRPGVCGDGQHYISGIGGRVDRQITASGMNISERTGWPPCLPGPGRVVATVMSGEVTHIRTFAGPVPALERETTDLGTATAAEARAYL